MDLTIAVLIVSSNQGGPTPFLIASSTASVREETPSFANALVRWGQHRIWD